MNLQENHTLNTLVSSLRKCIINSKFLRDFGIVLMIYGLWDLGSAYNTALAIKAELKQNPPIGMTVEQKKGELMQIMGVNQGSQKGAMEFGGGLILTGLGFYFGLKETGMK